MIHPVHWTPMTRVLVVEDEESYADALSYMLRKEGYDVSLAATGPDALAEFDRNGADIVLLDLMLPGQGGVCPHHQGASSSWSFWCREREMCVNL